MEKNSDKNESLWLYVERINHFRSLERPLSAEDLGWIHDAFGLTLQDRGEEKPVLKVFMPSDLYPIPEDLRNDYLHILLSSVRVEEYLDLSNCRGVTSLPENLHVDGSLNLRGCRDLPSLPDGLHVGKNLYLGGRTLQIPFPKNLHVGGYIDIDGSKIVKEQCRAMYEKLSKPSSKNENHSPSLK